MARPTRTGWNAAGAVACALTLLPVHPARALTINATMDGSITGSAYSGAIQSAINASLSFYSAFADPITVSIDFQLAPTGASYLGGTQASVGITSYASYAAALLNDAAAQASATELAAYVNLGSGNGAAQIVATTADFRALGFNLAGALDSTGGSTGSFDGIIALNASYLAGFGGGGSYTPLSVIQHEVDEVLGIGGSGSVLNRMSDSSLTTPPTFNNQTYIQPLDLFRYAAPGTPSLTTSGSATSYFSIDGGATAIAAFNQNGNGDYGDWGAPGCAALVQQAFTCANSPAPLSPDAPEVTALQAIGYNLAVPEPASASLLGSGLLGLVLRRRRRI